MKKGNASCIRTVTCRRFDGFSDCKSEMSPPSPVSGEPTSSPTESLAASPTAPPTGFAPSSSTVLQTSISATPTESPTGAPNAGSLNRVAVAESVVVVELGFSF
ncbi:hypothetical protein Hanom_Chr11g00991751 [Helianthus anomalus]